SAGTTDQCAGPVCSAASIASRRAATLSSSVVTRMPSVSATSLRTLSYSISVLHARASTRTASSGGSHLLLRRLCGQGLVGSFGEGGQPAISRFGGTLIRLSPQFVR